MKPPNMSVSEAILVAGKLLREHQAAAPGTPMCRLSETEQAALNKLISAANALVSGHPKGGTR